MTEVLACDLPARVRRRGPLRRLSAAQERLVGNMERNITALENRGLTREAASADWARLELLRGNPDPFNALNRLKRFPVTIEEFVEGRDFVGVMEDFRVWPAWQQELRSICPDVVTGEQPVHEVVLGGASGTGKTTVAQISLAYQVYLLTCFEAPSSPFPDMSGFNAVVFPLFSLKPTITRDVIYQPLRRLLTSMPYMKKYSNYDKYRDSGLYMHQDRIHVLPQLAMDTSMQGQAVCGGILDEMAFMAVIEESKQVPGPRGQGGKFDQAEQLHRQAVNRRNRSCRTRGVSVGSLCVLSNTRYQGDFMDRRLAELEADPRSTVYHRRLMRHTMKPQDVEACRRRDVVSVLVGSAGYATRLLGDDERKGREYPTGAWIIKVPSEYRDQFVDDPDGALREVCGVSTGAIAPFIGKREKIHESFVRGKRLPLWVDKQNVDLGHRGYPEWVEANIPDNREYPRYAHIDLSKSKDRCGVAVVRVAGYTYVTEGDEELTQEMVPYIEVEVAVSIKPSGTHQIDPAEVRSWLMRLSTEHGIEVAGVSYDGFQSQESIQRWVRAGVRSRLVSVDRDSGAYQDFRRALYQDRVDVVDNPLLGDELLNLEFNEAKDKVDHPPKGCFTGDTRVALLDGTLPSFEELAERYPDGESFAVYTMREDGVGVGWARHPRITKTVSQIVEVTLDNYQVVRCTADHLFMLLDGSWCRADALTPDSRIMPLYRQRQNKGGWSGYEQVWCPVRRRRMLVHHVVAEQELGGVPEGHVVHHKNRIRHDNDPSNLEVVDRAEHARAHTTQRHKEDPEWVSRLRRGHEVYRESGGNEKSRKNMVRLHREGRMTRTGRASRQQNHRILSASVIDRQAEVWDLTVDETHNFALASGVFVHNSKDVADAVAGACWLAVNSRTIRMGAAYVNASGERVNVRRSGRDRPSGREERPAGTRFRRSR